MATKVWISTSSTSFNTGANWSGGAAPANDDVLVFNSSGTANVETNLSTILTGIVIVKERSYVGQIGVKTANTYTYLVLDGGTLYYEQNTGQGDPNGSPLCMINFGSTAAVAVVYDSHAQSSTSYYPPLLLKGTSLTLHQSGGSVGVAADPGGVSTLTAARITKGDGKIAPGLYLGPGVTTTALTAETGKILSRAENTVTAATLSGDASYEWMGTGAHTALTIEKGAIVKHKGTGTITTLNLSGRFDRTAETRALTVTTQNLYHGAEYLLDNGVSGSVTRTTKNFVKCSIQDVKITLPLEEQF